MIFRKNPFLLLAGIAFVFQNCSRPKQFIEMLPENTGIHFKNVITETEHNNIMTYEYTYNGGGLAVGDINNDGLADVYFSGNSVPNKLYLNNGDWKFEDVTKQTGTAGRDGWKTGVSMADVNGDGWLDIYVCYSGNAQGEGFNKPVIIDHPKRANQLFINKGCEEGGIPVFEEKAKDFGLDAIGTFSTQAYFFDYDRDGDLDMFLLNHANMFYSTFFNVKKLRSLRHPYFGNKLYRNDILSDRNKSVFVEVSENSGIHGSGLNFGLSASISDLNNDNWPDIYVTNDYDEQDFCYINNRDGTFSEASHKIFGHLSKYGMGSDIADINNDGLPDIFVGDMLPEDNYRQKILKGPDEYDKYSLAVDSGYHHQYMRNTLQLHKGFAPDSLPRFSEIGQLAGVSNTDWSWASLFADFNNDGLKDLFITNGYLRDYTNLDFVKYTVQDAVNEANDNNHPVDLLSLIQQIPSTNISNYAFANDNGIHFTNATEEWGLNKKGISNAAAYADFDNDGDLDLVVNNINEEAFVYQNQQDKIQKNNYIKIKLVGEGNNLHGIGARIKMTTDDQEIYYENHFTRGYQSSVEQILTVGLGKADKIKEVKVIWPDDKVSVLQDVPVNKLLVVDKKRTADGEHMAKQDYQVILRNVTQRSGLNFRHSENPFVDFKHQRLLPYQLSRLGGKLAVGDVDGDGNDDAFFGGAAGQPSTLYLGNDDGTLSPSLNQPWEADSLSEDLEALFFDADSDGDSDLYVVSGGNEFRDGDAVYQDRLYVNNGKGEFEKHQDALPYETHSGSCVEAGDYDNDGDLDLFVGSRLVPQNYPLPPKNLLLRNDTQNSRVKFTDVTKELSETFSKLGMVTDATWTDIDNDSWPDLVVVGDWMPVRVFKNEKGKLQEISDKAGLVNTNGWWNKIFSGDFDGDGDVDFLLGNAGTNMQLKASQEEPMTYYIQDMNKDGQLDPLLSYFIQGKSYPIFSRDELLEQVVPLRKKYIKYAQYANATVDDLLKEAEVTSTRFLTTYTLESAYLENTGSGKFVLKPLPYLAQESMANGFAFEDFDGDGSNEILMAGNFYPYRVQLGRCDASTGLLLKIVNGQPEVVDAKSSLWLDGDIRDLAVMKFNKAPKHIVVSRNNDVSGLFEFVF